MRHSHEHNRIWWITLPKFLSRPTKGSGMTFMHLVCCRKEVSGAEHLEIVTNLVRHRELADRETDGAVHWSSLCFNATTPVSKLRCANLLFQSLSSMFSDRHGPCFRCTHRPNSVLYPIQAPPERPQTVFPITILPMGDRTNFVQKRTMGSSMCDHDFGHLCRGRRIHILGHSDFGIWSHFGASSLFFWVWADTASAPCPAQSGSLAKTLRPSFVAQLNLALWIQHKSLNRLSLCHLGAPHPAFVLLILRF